MLKIGTTIISGLESRYIVFLDDEGSTFHLRVFILANDYFEKIVVLVYLNRLNFLDLTFSDISFGQIFADTFTACFILYIIHIGLTGITIHANTPML